MRKNRASYIAKLRRLIIDRPNLCRTFEDIKRETGISVWALRYNFSSPDGLLRAVFADLVNAVSANVIFEDDRTIGVLETLTDYSNFLGDLMRGTLYGDLGRFIARYGVEFPWVGGQYVALLHLIRKNLQASILRAGESLSMAITLSDDDAMQMIKEIERHNLYNHLMPLAPSRDSVLGEFEAALARAMLACTYNFGNAA